MTKNEKIAENCSEDDEEEEYVPSEEEESSEAESSAEDEKSEEEEEEEEPVVLKKRKSNASTSKATSKRTNLNKDKKEKISPPTDELKDGKKIPPKKVSKKRKNQEMEVSGEQKGEKKEDKKKTNSKKVEFNTANCDKNFYAGTTTNVVTRRVQLNNNNILACQVQEAEVKGGSAYEYAALSFIRKNKDGSAFEFNLPLSLVPQIMEGLTYIVNENKKFFPSLSL